MKTYWPLLLLFVLWLLFRRRTSPRGSTLQDDPLESRSPMVGALGDVLTLGDEEIVFVSAWYLKADERLIATFFFTTGEGGAASAEPGELGAKADDAAAGSRDIVVILPGRDLSLSRCRATSALVGSSEDAALEFEGTTLERRQRARVRIYPAGPAPAPPAHEVELAEYERPTDAGAEPSVASTRLFVLWTSTTEFAAWAGPDVPFSAIEKWAGGIP